MGEARIHAQTLLGSRTAVNGCPGGVNEGFRRSGRRGAGGLFGLVLDWARISGGAWVGAWDRGSGWLAVRDEGDAEVRKLGTLGSTCGLGLNGSLDWFGLGGGTAWRVCGGGGGGCPSGEAGGRSGGCGAWA